MRTSGGRLRVRLRPSPLFPTLPLLLLLLIPSVFAPTTLLAPTLLALSTALAPLRVRCSSPLPAAAHPCVAAAPLPPALCERHPVLDERDQLQPERRVRYSLGALFAQHPRAVNPAPACVGGSCQQDHGQERGAPPRRPRQALLAGRGGRRRRRLPEARCTAATRLSESGVGPWWRWWLLHLRLISSQ